MKDSFKSVAATEQSLNWENLIKREENLYSRSGDIRSEFARDYTRILHCNAYRRLKHKTQVFFSPASDHVCTRIEHVNYVESISNTIANYLGLNTELTKAISIAHDLGHSPFGHKGEVVLNEIAKRDLGESFWHERNGLHFVDDIELLEDEDGNLKNLDLTYAVRDGIISHCGEIDENCVKPRSEYIDLAKEYTMPNHYNPYTWEGCVVKISDKISYLGRDLEDAIHLKLLTKDNIEELKEILNIKSEDTLNNPNIINELIIDLCNNSSIEKGLCFSEEKLNLMNKIKAFNYKNIYLHKRLDGSNEYFRVLINRIYNTLKGLYAESYEDIENNFKEAEKFYPDTMLQFRKWLNKYWELTERQGTNLKNKIVYKYTEQDYCRAIIDFIAGMTDNFVINIYNEIISF
ncbi:MAG: HD domain-containing protein [Clostridia bacterium]|nr:HD domain-containing protein [Clostridia bacterium]